MTDKVRPHRAEDVVPAHVQAGSTCAASANTVPESIRRAPFQVLVIPYRLASTLEFAAFRRASEGYWQFVAGGGNEGEDAERAARRELIEETGIPCDVPLLRLQSVASIPVSHFPAREHWPRALLVVPEYCFAADATGFDFALSNEHAEYEWLSFEACHARLHWQSNQVALWELNERLTRRTRG